MKGEFGHQWESEAILAPIFYSDKMLKKGTKMVRIIRAERSKRLWTSDLNVAWGVVRLFDCFLRRITNLTYRKGFSKILLTMIKKRNSTSYSKQVHKTQRRSALWLLVGCTSKLIHRELESIDDHFVFII